MIKHFHARLRRCSLSMLRSVRAHISTKPLAPQLVQLWSLCLVSVLRCAAFLWKTLYLGWKWDTACGPHSHPYQFQQEKRMHAGLLAVSYELTILLFRGYLILSSAEWIKATKQITGTTTVSCLEGLSALSLLCFHPETWRVLWVKRWVRSRL